MAGASYFGQPYFGQYGPDESGFLDAVEITATVTVAVTLTLACTDAVGVTATCATLISSIRTFNNSVDITDTMTAQMGVNASDAVGITATVTTESHITVALTDAVGISDTFQVTTIRISDSVGITATVVANVAFIYVAANAVGITDTISVSYASPNFDVVGISGTLSVIEYHIPLTPEDQEDFPSSGGEASAFTPSPRGSSGVVRGKTVGIRADSKSGISVRDAAGSGIFVVAPRGLALKIDTSGNIMKKYVDYLWSFQECFLIGNKLVVLAWRPGPVEAFDGMNIRLDPQDDNWDSA